MAINPGENTEAVPLSENHVFLSSQITCLNETMKTVEQLKGKQHLKPTSEVTATVKRTKRLLLNALISSKLAFFKSSSCLIKYMYEIYYSLVVVILISNS